MIVLIDNYDSFTFNLVHYFGELGADVVVHRNDKVSVADVMALQPDAIVLSPGPCTPNEAGISVDAMRRFPEAGVPALGVCLGHQSLAQAFGGKVVRHEPVHGKSTVVEHDGRTIFTGLESPLTVGRYHSLVVERSSLPAALAVSTIMRSSIRSGSLMARSTRSNRRTRSSASSSISSSESLMMRNEPWPLTV